MPRLTAPLAAALSLCLLASPLPAQALRERPLVYHGLVYLGDEALHKELKLSAEEVKKVAAFRATWLPRYLSSAAGRSRARGVRNTEIGREAEGFLTARDAEIAQEADKFLEGLLSATQQARLLEVVLQQLG